MKKSTRTQEPVEPLLLTVPQVAGMLGLGRTKVYDLIDREGLPTVKLGTASTTTALLRKRASIPIASP